MAAIMDPVLAEFREEAAITKRILDRVPDQNLAWKPHDKSMSLGQLAWHIAVIPGNLSRMLLQDTFDVLQGNFSPPLPKSNADILSAYEESVREAEKNLRTMTDQKAQGSWQLTRGSQEVFSRPRIQVLRSIMLNHWYHHRGQL